MNNLYYSTHYNFSEISRFLYGRPLQIICTYIRSILGLGADLNNLIYSL